MEYEEWDISSTGLNNKWEKNGDRELDLILRS